MIDETTDEVPAIPPSRKRPQPKRQPRGRKVYISRMQEDGVPIAFGNFNEAVIGEPLEQRILPFMEERNLGPGVWKVQIHNSKGHFERSLDFTIEEPSGNGGRVIDADSIEDDFLDADTDDLEPDYLEPNAGTMTATEVENLLLKERLRRLEEDAQRQRSAGSAETTSMLGMLQQSWAQQRDFMMLMLQQAQAQPQQPQIDATSQALKLMEQSLGMVKSARAFADEIAPDGGGEGGGSFLADGAKLLDSVGRHAGTLLPILGGFMAPPPNVVSGHQSAAPTTSPWPPPSQNGQPSGELGDLAAKIREKQGAEVTPEKSEAAGAK